MKKTISVCLILCVLLCSIAVLAACDEEPPAAPPSAAPPAAQTPPPQQDPPPDGYQWYQDDYLRFAYPDGWDKSTLYGITILTPSTPNAETVNVVYEACTNTYYNMTAEQYAELVGPTLEAQNMIIDDVTVEHKSKNGAHILRVDYLVHTQGSTFAQTQLVLASGDRDCVITINHAVGESELLEKIYDTVKVRKTTSAWVPEGYLLYQDGYISLAYPKNWVKTEQDGAYMLSGGALGDNFVLIDWDTATSDAYQEITVQDAIENLTPVAESEGAELSGVTVEKKIKGPLTVMEMQYTLTVMGVSVENTVFLVRVDDRLYTLTLCEYQQDDDMIKAVYHTLRALK